MAVNDKNKTAAKIISYHEETKHHYERYARSPGYMDWQNQPNPFRFYENTKVYELPLLKKKPEAGYPDLYLRKNNPAQLFVIENIAGFLELSLGLSAWKAMGNSRWSLRINPSSGNLHPTEAHLILPHGPNLAGGIYHYNAFIHALELRAETSEDLRRQITQHFGCEGFLIGLSSIFWRESWKYGERAFRYCNHDVGHALAAVSIAANLFGWKVTYLNGLSDDALDTVLGFDKTGFEYLEREHPDLMCFVHPSDRIEIPRAIPLSIIDDIGKLNFTGTPNRLSKQQINWEIIYQAADLTRKPSTAEQTFDFSDTTRQQAASSQLSSVEIICRRRSATDYDRTGSLSKNRLITMLDQTLPRNGIAPFDAELMETSTHLLIFIHQVEGLAPGLYFFCRNSGELDSLKRRTHSGFAWQPVEEDFPLFLLEKGNYRQQAMMVSCHQDIAGSSALSLGMIVRFKDLIGVDPYRYRHLFWETGMVGQVLYLEAEAHGVRGTGIGCYFDDAVHELLGLTDNHYQSLYHFTIGCPVEDPRLTTYPPYGHLKNR